jgi:para-aminobenzoate synthetase/4-amino-4-deoxychorismate lyase
MDSAPRPEPFSLLETMRLDEGDVPRLDRHVRRMATAARHFGYRWDEDEVRKAIAAAVHDRPLGVWRLRLLVDRAGVASVECMPYEPDDDRLWRLAFAAEPIDDVGDPFLLHKTTRRVIHEAARRSKPDADDVLLWNRRGEVTETTLGNLVAELDGVRYTPPLACGLLGGTFRAEQLEAGTIRERVLAKSDVTRASRLWLINSVREWVEGRLE